MTEKDRSLIEKARSVNSLYWPDINELIEMADTEECRQQLRDIRSRLYHIDEYHAGLD